MGEPIKEVESWLRSQILIARPGGNVVRIEVRHLPLGSKKGHEVALIEVPSNVNDEWFEATGAEIGLGMQCDADAMGGVQRYALVPFRDKEPDRPQGRKLIRIAAETLDSDEEEGGFDSEPKNIKGTLAMLMRHNEAYAKTLANVFSTALATQARQLSRVTEHNEKLLTQRFESIELIEELQTERHKREIETMQDERKAKMLADIMGEVKLLGPAIVNGIAGKNVLPVANDPAKIALQRLAASLTPEQVAQVAGALNETQQVAFGEILKAIQPN